MNPPSFLNLLTLLKKKGIERTYPPNTVIVSKGDHKNKTAFIIDGLLKACIDEPNNTLLLYHLDSQKPSVISFINIYTKTPIGVSITTLTNSRLLWIENSDLLVLGNQSIDIKKLMINSYNHVSKSLLLVLKNIISDSLEARVLEYLQAKVQLHQNSNITIPRQEIAEDLNISRVTLSRALKRLETEDKVQRNIRSIKLLAV
ncbi:Crp/Fnr family transcriptional regulator [Aquimarina rhabdastrellae]